MVNRKVEELFTQGRSFAIDLRIGIEYLSRYLEEVYLAGNGIGIEELGIKERKADSKPKLIDTESGKIAVYNIRGMMRYEPSISSVGMASIAEAVLQNDRNPEVVGHIFKINSGGGELDAGEVLANAIADASKGTIALCQTCGSAAYLAASNADVVLMTSPLASAGSIGVFVEINKQFAQLYKQHVDAIYSDNSPLKNKGWRDYLAGSIDSIKQDITHVDELFMEQIRKNRVGVKEQALLGKMYNAEEAINLGLADGYGTYSQAINFFSKTSIMESKNFFANLFSKSDKSEQYNSAQNDVTENKEPTDEQIANQVIASIEKNKVSTERLSNDVEELNKSLTSIASRLNDVELSIGEMQSFVDALDKKLTELDSAIAEAKANANKTTAKKSELTAAEKALVSRAKQSGVVIIE